MSASPPPSLEASAAEPRGHRHLVPPRPRLRWHVASVLAAVLLTPGAIVLVAFGAQSLLNPSTAAAQGLPPDWSVLLGALVLGGVVALGQFSSLGAVVGGLTWGLVATAAGRWAPGVAEEAWDSIAHALNAPSEAAASLGLITRVAEFLGVVLAASGVAAHYARRAGRRQERDDDAQLAATGALAPPRSRLIAHITYAVLAVLVLPAGLIALGGGVHSTLASHTDAYAWVVAVLVVSAVALSAAASSLGALVSGLAWGVVPGAVLLAWDAALEWVRTEPLGAEAASAIGALATSGLSLVVGAALTSCAIASHGARRAGRAHERAEIAIQRLG